MSAPDRHEQARLLRSWHLEPRLLVLPNAWDVASAVAFARLPGCRAIATTSGGVARSLGFEDGAAPGGEMLRVAARIAEAVEIPVTADLERNEMVFLVVCGVFVRESVLGNLLLLERRRVA